MNIAKLMTGTASVGTAWDADASEPLKLAESDSHRDGTDVAEAEKTAAFVQKTPPIDMIEALRAEINANSRSRLQIDRETVEGRFIYRILDPDTGETMRQWPPENYLDLMEFLRDQRGGVIDETA